MAYQLEITPAALRAAKKLSPKVRRAIVKKLQVLKENPLKGQKLRGQYYFLRFLHFSPQGTEYRVIYEVNKKKSKNYIRYADSRENFYRGLEKMKLKSVVK